MKKNGIKYLVFNSADKNKEVLKKYTEFWDGIKNEIKAINGGKKKLNLTKILWGLKLTQMIICH